MADHLGHSDNDFMISAAIVRFWKAFTLFMSDFGCLYSFIKCKILNNIDVVVYDSNYGF